MLLQALGLEAAANDVRDAVVKTPSQKPRREKTAPPSSDRRESERTKGSTVNYNEDAVDSFFGTKR